MPALLKPILVLTFFIINPKETTQYNWSQAGQDPAKAIRPSFTRMSVRDFSGQKDAGFKGLAHSRRRWSEVSKPGEAQSGMQHPRSWDALVRLMPVYGFGSVDKEKHLNKSQLLGPPDPVPNINIPKQPCQWPRDRTHSRLRTMLYHEADTRSVAGPVV